MPRREQVGQLTAMGRRNDPVSRVPLASPHQHTSTTRLYHNVGSVFATRGRRQSHSDPQMLSGKRPRIMTLGE